MGSERALLDYAGPDTGRGIETNVAITESPGSTALVLSPRFTAELPFAIAILAGFAIAFVFMAMMVMIDWKGLETVVAIGLFLGMAALMLLMIAREVWGLRQATVLRVFPDAVLCEQPRFFRIVTRRHALVEEEWVYVTGAEYGPELSLRRPDGAVTPLLKPPVCWNCERLERAAWLINQAIDRQRRGVVGTEPPISAPWA